MSLSAAMELMQFLQQGKSLGHGSVNQEVKFQNFFTCTNLILEGTGKIVNEEVELIEDHTTFSPT